MYVCNSWAVRPGSINRENLSVNLKPSARGFKETFKGFTMGHIQFQMHRRLMSYMLSGKQRGGFPGGSVVKNLPANAGDMGSIPDLGRFLMLQDNKAHDPQLLSPRAATTDASTSRACALPREKPLQ